MSYTHVTTDAEAEALAERLADVRRLALDCEAAGFHRYSDRLCLVQLTIGDDDYIVDPQAVDAGALLRDPLEREDTEILMHGADFDLRLLSRDLGIRLRGLYDTQVAASLIGEESLGLQALLESRLGVKLSKKYQRADWAKRPLDDAMLDYAASDTRYLHRLVESLRADVGASGRTAWVAEECEALEEVADLDHDEDDDEDPVTRVKGARKLDPRQVTALRAALEWRDEIAKERDRALFRVVGDRSLVDAVARHPRRVEELRDIKGFPGRLAGEAGKELIRRLNAVTEMSDDELVPYPRGVRRGTGRPPPELEEMVNRLKSVRNRAADEIGLPRGTLLPNAALLAVARDAPRTLEQLLEVEGLRPWKAEVLGDRLLGTLHG